MRVHVPSLTYTLACATRIPLSLGGERHSIRQRAARTHSEKIQLPTLDRTTTSTLTRMFVRRTRVPAIGRNRVAGSEREISQAKSSPRRRRRNGWSQQQLFRASVRVRLGPGGGEYRTALA